MFRHKVRFAPSGKGKAVDEEKGKDNQDRAEDIPPQLLLHHRLRILFAIYQILHGHVERV